MEQIVLVGGGGHTMSIADALSRLNSFQLIGYTDVRDKGICIPYLGTDEILPVLFSKGCRNAIVGLGYMGADNNRKKIYTLLKSIGFQLPPIVDPSAVLAKDIFLAEGVFVGKKAVVNTNSSIEKMCIINTGAVVEHGNHIGESSHVAVGAVLCGDVTVGDHCLIGANATVLQGIKIGENSVIGAGAVVTKDVEPNCTVVGVPAKPIK